MIEIKAEVIGAEVIERRFAYNAPNKIRDQVRKAVRGLGYQLQRNVQTGPLNGGVLNRRSGRLARSVNTRFVEDNDLFQSFVGSKSIYGRAWELGFHVPAMYIEARRAGALYWEGAAHPIKWVMIPARTEAARPWLRPSLDAMAPTIHDTLTAAVRYI